MEGSVERTEKNERLAHCTAQFAALHSRLRPMYEGRWPEVFRHLKSDSRGSWATVRETEARADKAAIAWADDVGSLTAFENELSGHRIAWFAALSHADDALTAATGSSSVAVTTGG